MADERDAMLTIKDAFLAIRKLVGRRSYADLTPQDEAYRGTLQQFGIIASAARVLSAETRARYPNVDWAMVAALPDTPMDARRWDLATKQLLLLKDAAENEVARLDSR